MVQEVFGKEKMKLENADLNEELGIMAREFQMPADKLIETLKKNQSLNELQFRAMFRKVTGFLDEHASKQEVSA